MATVPANQTPATQPKESLEEQFQRLAAVWRAETAYLSSSGDLRPYEFCCRQLAELGPAQIAPPRLLSGHDLIALGLQPGPQFKEILNAVEEAQLEGRLLTREDALDWVKQYRQDRERER